MFSAYPLPTTSSSPGTSASKRFRQEFTASGTFTVPAGVTRVWAFLVGGGASGGSGNTSDYNGNGGGGGGIVDGYLDVTAGAAMSVVVAQGGAAVTTALGSAGGQSTFGALTAPGGQPGSATAALNVAGPWQAGNTGGAPGNARGGWGGSCRDGNASMPQSAIGQDGDFAGFGGGGGAAYVGSNQQTYRGGHGGGGRGGAATTASTAYIQATAGTPNTGGGGGGMANNGNGAAPSGAGGSGFVRIEWDA